MIDPGASRRRASAGQETTTAAGAPAAAHPAQPYDRGKVRRGSPRRSEKLPSTAARCRTPSVAGSSPAGCAAKAGGFRSSVGRAMTGVGLSGTAPVMLSDRRRRDAGEVDGPSPFEPDAPMAESADHACVAPTPVKFASNAARAVDQDAWPRFAAPASRADHAARYAHRFSSRGGTASDPRSRRGQRPRPRAAGMPPGGRVARHPSSAGLAK